MLNVSELKSILIDHHTFKQRKFDQPATDGY